MTTGRINQVTAFSLRPRAQARSSRTPHGTGYGTCLARPNGTALVTARWLDFALLCTEHHTPVSNPFTQASSSAWSASWSVSRRAHTHTLTHCNCLDQQLSGQSSLPRWFSYRLHSTLLPTASGDHWCNTPCDHASHRSRWYSGREPINARCHGTGTVSASSFSVPPSLVWTEAC